MMFHGSQRSKIRAVQFEASGFRRRVSPETKQAKKRARKQRGGARKGLRAMSSERDGLRSCDRESDNMGDSDDTDVDEGNHRRPDITSLLCGQEAKDKKRYLISDT